MAGKRRTHKHLPEHLYVMYGRRCDSYYTISQGKYFGLGNDRQKAEQKLRDMIAGTPVTGSIADMCHRFITFQRELLANGDPAALAPRTIDDYSNDLDD